MPDFNLLLQQFEGDLSFQSLLGQDKLEPDELGYFIQTNRGLFLVYETDYISSFSMLKKRIQKISNYVSFVKVKQPLKFDQSLPVKSVSIYQKPPDWDEISLFANDKYCTQNLFCFLIKLMI